MLRALFGSDLDRLIASEGSSPFDLLTRETRRDLPLQRNSAPLTRHVIAMIDARRKERRIEMDLLSMLMEARDRDSGEAMPDRAILDEIMTLIVAGHETPPARSTGPGTCCPSTPMSNLACTSPSRTQFRCLRLRSHWR